MAGIIDGLLGAALGASGAVVNNAQFARQQQAEQDKENRAMNRETFLMQLRAKYAQDQAQFNDGLERGRMDKQAQITRDNAKYSNDLAMDGLNDPRKIDAEKRQRQGAMEDYQTKGDIDSEEWAKRNGVTHAQALELLGKQQAGQRSLLNMKLAAKGGGTGAGGGDDDEEGSPDFVGARKDLTKFFGLDGAESAINKRPIMQKYGIKDDKDMAEVMDATTNLYAANPSISPSDALKIGNDIARNRLPVQVSTLPDGRRVQYVTIGGKRYMYGRAR